MLAAMNRRLRRCRTNNNHGGSRIPGQTLFWNSSPGNLLPPSFPLTRTDPGTYFDSAGLLQTAAIDAPRGTYRWNGSAWVFDGTMIEAAATNSLLRSRALGTAPWVLTGTAGAQNATGIDGSANTAWTLTDANAGTFDGYYSSGAVTIIANTSPTAFSVFVLKDSDNTTFPALRAVDVGVSVATDVVFNTSTGAFTAQQILGTGGGNVEDYGTHWKVTAYFNNNGAVTGAQCTFFPAYTTGTTASAANVAAQRSCVVDQFDHRPNSTVTDSPIITAGVAVPRAEDVLTAPTAGLLVNGQGFTAIGARIIAYGGAGPNVAIGSPTGGFAAPLYFTSSSGQLTSYDGTNACSYGASTAAPAVGAVFKAATTWSGVTFGGALNGVVGTPSTAFDGNINLDTSIQIGNGIGNTVPLSMVLQSLRLGVQAVGSGRLAAPFT